MKYIVLLITFILSISMAQAQSKKEIIKTLNTRIDSLNQEIKKSEIKYEQDVFSFSIFKETLLNQIKELEKDLQSAQTDIAAIQKIKNQLNGNNLKLQYELGTLKDSILKLNIKLLSSNYKVTENIAKGLNKVKSKWDYFMSEFANEQYILKDSLNKICNDQRCVSFLLTNGFLVATYRIKDVNEFGTQIIDLTSNQDLLSSTKSNIYVEGFDKEKNILEISSEGYDGNGRYWQYGIWSLNEKTMKLGKKEY